MSSIISNRSKARIWATTGLSPAPATFAEDGVSKSSCPAPKPSSRAPLQQFGCTAPWVRRATRLAHGSLRWTLRQRYGRRHQPARSRYGWPLTKDESRDFVGKLSHWKKGVVKQAVGLLLAKGGVLRAGIWKCWPTKAKAKPPARIFQVWNNPSPSRTEDFDGDTASADSRQGSDVRALKLPFVRATVKTVWLIRSDGIISYAVWKAGLVVVRSGYVCSKALNKASVDIDSCRCRAEDNPYHWSIKPWAAISRRNWSIRCQPRMAAPEERQYHHRQVYPPRARTVGATSCLSGCLKSA